MEYRLRITRQIDYLAEDTYVVFDVETTGLSAVYDTIIELAAVKMKDGEIIDRFESFANPHHQLIGNDDRVDGNHG